VEVVRADDVLGLAVEARQGPGDIHSLKRGAPVRQAREEARARTSANEKGKTQIEAYIEA